MPRDNTEMLDAAMDFVFAEFQAWTGVTLRADEWQLCRTVLAWLVVQRVADPERLIGYIRVTLKEVE